MSLYNRAFAAFGAVMGIMAVQSASAYTNSFETATVGDLITLTETAVAGWYGYGAVSNTESQVLAAGAPAQDAHTKHVAVDGWVTNAFGSADGDAQLDLLVRVSKPEESLAEAPDDDAKFALAIDSDGTLKCYLNSVWTSLGSTVYAEDQWIRIAVIFDNTGKRCKVSVDGNACNTANGYTDATGSTTGGPWYNMIATTSRISSLKVVGSTALDDVVLTQVSNSSYVPEYKDAEGHDIVVDAGTASVPIAWYDKNNIATNVKTTTDGSGMTIAEKYVTGLNPTDGSKFEMTTMSMKEEGGTVKAVIDVPYTAPEGYTVKVQTWNGTAWDTGTAPVEGKATIALPSGDSKVTKFRMVSVAD